MNQPAEEPTAEEIFDAVIVEESTALVPVPFAMNRIRPVLAEETAFVIAKAGEVARIYPLPVPAQRVIDRLPILLAEAEVIELNVAEDVGRARELGKEANALNKAIMDDCYQPVKRFIDAVKQVVLDKERDYLETPAKVKTILAAKMTAWDVAEHTRIAEEQRIQAQEEERKRQLALTNARKKLDGLMETSASLEEELSKLCDALEAPDLTDTMAEMTRARMRTIQAQLDTVVERSQVVEQRVEEVSQPIAPVQNVAQVKTATGVSQVKEITAINMKALVRWLAKDGCPVDPATILKAQEGAIKTMIQKMNIEGVSWRWASRTRF